MKQEISNPEALILQNCVLAEGVDGSIALVFEKKYKELVRLNRRKIEAIMLEGLEEVEEAEEEEAEEEEADNSLDLYVVETCDEVIMDVGEAIDYLQNIGSAIKELQKTFIKEKGIKVSYENK